MSLHPCECGEDDFMWSQHEMDERPEGLVSTYLGNCPRCGAMRQFDFAVKEVPTPPPAFGGVAPSQIIDPGEFFDLSQRAAATATRDVDGIDGRSEAHDAAVMAVNAIEEVLKFVPDGGVEVPQQAFTSPAGRARRVEDPGRFRRDHLEGLLLMYRERLRVTPRPLGTEFDE